MVLLTALLMLEESRLNKPVLPLNHPKSYQQHIDTTNATARILDLTPSLPASLLAQLDLGKSIDEIWRTLRIKTKHTEIIVLNAENRDNIGNTDTPNSYQ